MQHPGRRREDPDPLVGGLILVRRKALTFWLSHSLQVKVKILQECIERFCGRRKFGNKLFPNLSGTMVRDRLSSTIGNSRRVWASKLDQMQFYCKALMLFRLILQKIMKLDDSNAIEHD